MPATARRSCVPRGCRPATSKPAASVPGPSRTRPKIGNSRWVRESCRAVRRRARFGIADRPSPCQQHRLVCAALIWSALGAGRPARSSSRMMDAFSAAHGWVRQRIEVSGRVVPSGRRAAGAQPSRVSMAAGSSVMVCVGSAVAGSWWCGIGGRVAAGSGVGVLRAIGLSPRGRRGG